MQPSNSVCIATSIDGYIADERGGIDWLQSIPNPDGIDMGYLEFSSRMDAIVIGRSTFELVCSFDVEWPHKKPVFVLSSRLVRLLRKVPISQNESILDEIFTFLRSADACVSGD